MRFPFVARSTYDEVKQQRDDFKVKYERLLNQFVYRGTGVALDPDELPKALRPRREAEPQHHLMDAKPEPAQFVDPRTALKRAEEAREKAYAESLGKIPAAASTIEVQERDNVRDISKGA